MNAFIFNQVNKAGRTGLVCNSGERLKVVYNHVSIFLAGEMSVNGITQYLRGTSLSLYSLAQNTLLAMSCIWSGVVWSPQWSQQWGTPLSHRLKGWLSPSQPPPA